MWDHERRVAQPVLSDVKGNKRKFQYLLPSAEGRSDICGASQRNGAAGFLRSKAPEMFCESRNFSGLSISVRQRRRLLRQFWADCSFSTGMDVLWCQGRARVLIGPHRPPQRERGADGRHFLPSPGAADVSPCWPRLTFAVTFHRQTPTKKSCPCGAHPTNFYSFLVYFQCFACSPGGDSSGESLKGAGLVSHSSVTSNSSSFVSAAGHRKHRDEGEREAAARDGEQQQQRR